MGQESLINNRYRIIEEIGQGGMAIVYRAEDETLGREVALKMIRTGQIPPDQLERVMERFRREARNLARLTDVPGVVTLHDYGVHAERPFLVMSYMPGGTLKEKMGTPMAVTEAVRLLHPITETLSFVHQMEIIHRDIKPSNLLIDRFGRLALADFGIAKAFDTGDYTLTGTGLGVGTAAYMAPEQWRGKSDLQSDIYALGVVFYELITGKRPFEGETASDVFLKVMTQDLPDPRTYVPALDEAVFVFLQNALAREVSQRYPDMRRMGAAMQDLLQPVIPQKPIENAAQSPRRGETVPTARSDDDETRDEYLKQLDSDETNLDAVSPVQPPKTPVQNIVKKTPIKEGEHVTRLNENELSIRLPGGIPMVFVRVPAGKFWMGSDDSDPMASADEKPQHEVYLDEYWIGKYPVTNRQYSAYLKSSRGAILPSDGMNIRYADHPATHVTWEDTVAFCQWLSKHSGQFINLPTEAQWEKSARGTDRQTYPWGNSKPTSSKANFGSSNRYTTPVGYHPEGMSPYGAFDMAGNIWEWVYDFYSENYYSKSALSEPYGAKEGRFHGTRGGAWSSYEPDLRTSNRGYSNPKAFERDLGFRCALILPEE